MNKLVTFLGGVVLFIAIVILKGWVLTMLWKWFIVPLGVAKIGIAWAIGIAMVVSMLTRESEQEKIATSDLLDRLLVAAITPLVVLLMGWIVHQFM